MPPECPLCVVSLGQHPYRHAPDRAFRGKCHRCGLVWIEATPDAWVRHSDADASPGPSDPSLPLVVRPGLGGWFLIYGLVAFICSAIALGFIVEASTGTLTWYQWVAFVVCVPVCLLVTVATLRECTSALLRLVFPARLDGSGDVIWVRVESGWGRRTDARVEKSAIRGVELRRWQHGLQEIWVTHESGLAFRAFGPRMPEEAQALRARISRWLRGPLV